MMLLIKIQIYTMLEEVGLILLPPLKNVRNFITFCSFLLNSSANCFILCLIPKKLMRQAMHLSFLFKSAPNLFFDQNLQAPLQ